MIDLNDNNKNSPEQQKDTYLEISSSYRKDMKPNVRSCSRASSYGDADDLILQTNDHIYHKCVDEHHCVVSRAPNEWH